LSSYTVQKLQQAFWFLVHNGTQYISKTCVVVCSRYYSSIHTFDILC